MIKDINIPNFLESGKTLKWTPNEDINILVGKNGSGKSVLLRQLEKEFDVHLISTFPSFSYADDLFLLCKEKITAAFKECTGLSLYVNKRNVWSYTNEEGEELSVQNCLPESYKQLLRLLYSVAHSVSDTILIDNIDRLGLHLSVQKNLIDALKMVSGKRQFIIVTHNPATAMGSYLDAVVDIKDLLVEGD